MTVVVGRFFSVRNVDPVLLARSGAVECTFTPTITVFGQGFMTHEEYVSNFRRYDSGKMPPNAGMIMGVASDTKFGYFGTVAIIEGATVNVAYNRLSCIVNSSTALMCANAAKYIHECAQQVEF